MDGLADERDDFDDLYPGEAYDDSMRLDELMTADDYNRFEENQVAMDRECMDWPDEGAYLDERADLAGDEAFIEEREGAPW